MSGVSAGWAQALIGPGDGVRHYYIAVTRDQFKFPTLVDLLGVLGKKDGLPIVLSCTSRDVLDALAEHLTRSNQFIISLLHSDVDPESERPTLLETFRLAMSEWNHFNVELSFVHPAEASLRPDKQHVFIVTDACLPVHALGEAPLHARVQINFDLPSKKESYSRRMAACLGVPYHAPAVMSPTPASYFQTSIGKKGKMVINMVGGHDIVIFGSLEESLNMVIGELPTNVSELVEI